MIRPGELNERVTVQQASESRNAFGETVLSWSTFAERWAKVEGVTFRESIQAGQQQTDVTHRIRMRYLTGLTGKMRVSWRGRILEIVSVLEPDSRSVHEIVCQEAA